MSEPERVKRSLTPSGLALPYSQHRCTMAAILYPPPPVPLSYEAYGPGGTGFIIEALTDNVNRTAGVCMFVE